MLDDAATTQNLGIDPVDGRAFKEARPRSRLCDCEYVCESIEFLDEVLILVCGSPAGAESFGDAQSEVRR